MIYTELTKRALRLCYAAHRDQTDKSGLPYVFHPFHLAEQMTDETTTVVALLHDVVEDTDYTLEDLAEMGYPAPVLEALALLTHDPPVPYLDYVARIQPNPVARAVKLADLRHNSDLTRLDKVGVRELQRIQKYQAAIRLLETSEEGRGTK
ncbi:MAG: GTP pyrophosphokinase [Clostridiales bacterium]|nr:GTP pyrophosphokinase [Clostridiales bacterium]